jgi:hypothetical protein
VVVQVFDDLTVVVPFDFYTVLSVPKLGVLRHIDGLDGLHALSSILKGLVISVRAR